MKSYQELIEERKKELMRGAATSTTSAPKALSVAEVIEKRKQELAKDVTTSVPTAAASAPSGVLDPVERARRLETPATQEVSKPYSRRGNVEARNIAAEPDVLSGRAQRFQLMNELEAELPFYKGTAEAEASYQQKLEDAQRSGQVSTLDSFDPQAVDDEMAGIAPYGSFTDGIGGQIEAGARLLNQPGTVGAKWRESDRSAEAGRKIREYLTTGKIAVGGPSQAFVNSGGYFPDQEQKYLEGSAAEAYIRDLTSKNEDTALVQAFDRDAGVVAKAFTNTLSQPEQLYSLAGGVAGGAVGMPGVGAAVGMTPLLEKALYSKYFQNIQLGIPNEESWNNALATLPVEGLAEWVGGRFGATGGVSRAAGISAAEEASAEVLGIGVDAASAAFVDPRFKGNLPRTFGEGAERVAVSSLSGGMGGAAIRSIPEFAKGAASMFSPRKATPLAEGAARARETLQAAGAFADGAAIPDAPDTGSTISFDPAINEALAAGQNEVGATTPPATTQKAPVAPPVKPQGQVSREASVAAGQRILNDLKTDPTLGVPEADRPRVLHERTKVYEAQEQAKLDGPKEVSKTLKLVRDIGKTVRTEPNILAGVEAPTNRILTNVTKGIAPLSATELAVRKMASEGRAPIIQQTGQPLQNAVPVAAPTTTKAQDQKAALGIIRRIGKEANATPALPVGLEASTNQIVSGITKGIEPLSSTEQFVRKMVRDAPAPRAPEPPAPTATAVPFNPATARFPEQPSSVEPTASVPQRIRVGGRFAPKGVVGTASTQPRGNITQGVPIVQSATLGEASTTIGATKALEAVEPIRVTQPEQQSQALVPTEAAPVSRGPESFPMPARTVFDRAVSLGVPAPRATALVATAQASADTTNSPMVVWQAPTGELQSLPQTVAPTVQGSTVVGMVYPSDAGTVSTQEAQATLPATPVAPTAVEAPVAIPAQPKAATGASPLPPAQRAAALRGELLPRSQEVATTQQPEASAPAPAIPLQKDAATGTWTDGKADAAVETALTPADKAEAAEALGFASWTTEAAKAFRQGMADFVASGVAASKRLADLFAKAIKAMGSAAIKATAIVSLTTSAVRDGTTQLDVDLLAPKQQTTAAPTAEFGNVTPTDSIRSMADWVLANNDNVGMPFVLADKPAGTLYFFSPNGTVETTVSALFGKTPGDVAPAERISMSLEDIRKDPKYHLTPAGRFESSTDTSKTYGEVVPIVKAGANSRVAIHRVFTGRPEEMRAARLSGDVPGSRITLGCINVDEQNAAFASDFFRNGGVTYIMPETPAGAQTFSGFAEAGVVPEATDNAPDASLDVDAPNAKERFASKEELLAELNSGFADKEATEARKVADSIVVYDGDVDLQSIDPEVAAAVEASAKKQGATGARPRAFQFKGKVYFNMEGVKKGEAKSAFLHEARVHLAAESEPARISSLAGRVVALAKMGDATAKESADTVGKEYPGLMEASKQGSDTAKDRAREEVLADFVQRVYERAKAGQGVTGLAKRLYSDAVSYFRDAYTTAAKKYLGEKFALTIKDTDILDAVRYGRTAAGFKGESKPTRSSKARDKSAAFMASPNPALPKALQDIPRGLPGLVDKILPKIQRLVSYKMGASPTVYSMVRDNIGGRNLKDWQTENLLAETRDAMRKSLGKRAGMYNDELVKALEGQSNTLPAEAKAAVASARLLIDGLTIKAMALGAMSPNNIVSAIKRVGSYVHDDYKAWKMGPGEWQSLQESPRGDGSNNAADLIMSVLPKMMQDIALPADAQLDALGALAQGKGKTAKKRAQAELDIMLGRYGFTQADATVDQQVAFLKKVRDSFTPDSFREHAAELARKLMNPKGIDSSSTMPFKPFSVDATGLKNKTKVPEWQKELWGKYEEYDAIVINTVRMLGGIVDKFASLEGYKQQLIDEGTIVQNKVPHGYTVLKDNDPLVYGPLNGYAIRDRDVALVGALAKQGVQGASAFLQGLTIGGAFGDALSKASSLSKIQAIVLAPDAWLFNATSTVMVGTLASGHPLAIAQHGKKAADFASREAFAGMGRTTKAVETDIQKVFEILFKRGVMGDSALAQDLRSDLAERVIDEAYKDAPAAKRMWHNAKSGAQGVADFGGRALSFGDTMGKVLSVYVRIPYLRNIYPNKTWDELLTIAADETADSLPSMSRSIPILRAMGRQGVFMPFAGYFAETFRNTLTDLGLGFKYQLMGLKLLSEGRVKEGIAAGLYGTMIHAGNIARHGIVWAVRSGIAASIYGMYQLAITAFGDDDEEPDDEAKKISAQVESARAIMEDPEKYKAFREMVPDDVTGDVVPLRELEPGVFSYTTTQRLDMYTTGAALTALERGDWSKKEAWQDAGVAMLSPFNQLSLVAKPVVDLLKGKEGAEWDLAASLLIPAPVKRADRITKAAEKGYEMTPFEKSMHMGGMTVSFFDAKQELANKMQGLASDVNDKMRAVTDSLDPNRKDVTERYTSTNKFSEEFSQAILAQAQMFKEFAPVIERAKFFGLSTQDIVAVAKLNGVSLSDTDLIGILDGKFTPTSAAKVITQKWQTELKAASQNPRQSARVNAYYKAALEDAKKVDEAALIMLKSEGMDVRGQQE